MKKSIKLSNGELLVLHTFNIIITKENGTEMRVVGEFVRVLEKDNQPVHD